MNNNEKPPHYANGGEMWRDYKLLYGAEATGICNRYLDMQIRSNDPEEIQFCKELYAEMQADPIIQNEQTTKKRGFITMNTENSNFASTEAEQKYVGSIVFPKGEVEKYYSADSLLAAYKASTEQSTAEFIASNDAGKSSNLSIAVIFDTEQFADAQFAQKFEQINAESWAAIEAHSVEKSAEVAVEPPNLASAETIEAAETPSCVGSVGNKLTGEVMAYYNENAMVDGFKQAWENAAAQGINGGDTVQYFDVAQGSNLEQELSNAYDEVFPVVEEPQIDAEPPVVGNLYFPATNEIIPYHSEESIIASYRKELFSLGINGVIPQDIVSPELGEKLYEVYAGEFGIDAPVIEVPFDESDIPEPDFAIEENSGIVADVGETAPIQAAEITNDITTPIRENSYVNDFVALLQMNGKDTKEFAVMISLIGGMENQLTEMTKDAKEMRQEISQLKTAATNPVRTALMNAADAIDGQIKSAQTSLNKVKTAFVESCKSAISAFKEKGASALNSVAKFFTAGFKKEVELYRKDAEAGIRENDRKIMNIENVSAQYHTVGSAVKNFGLALVGKQPSVETKQIGRVTKAVTSLIRLDSNSCQNTINRCNKILAAVERLEQGQAEKSVEKPQKEQKPSLLASIAEKKEIIKARDAEKLANPLTQVTARKKGAALE
jgi:hypothetical protein